MTALAWLALWPVTSVALVALWVVLLALVHIHH